MVSSRPRPSRQAAVGGGAGLGEVRDALEVRGEQGQRHAAARLLVEQQRAQRLLDGLLGGRAPRHLRVGAVPDEQIHRRHRLLAARSAQPQRVRELVELVVAGVQHRVGALGQRARHRGLAPAEVVALKRSLDQERAGLGDRVRDRQRRHRDAGGVRGVADPDRLADGELAQIPQLLRHLQPRQPSLAEPERQLSTVDRHRRPDGIEQVPERADVVLVTVRQHHRARRTEAREERLHVGDQEVHAGRHVVGHLHAAVDHHKDARGEVRRHVPPELATAAHRDDLHPAHASTAPPRARPRARTRSGGLAHP